VRDQAPVDRDDIMGAVAVQASDTTLVDGKRDDGAPAQAGFVAGDGLDVDLDVEAGDPVELLSDDRGLQSSLCLQAGVLPIAAAAARRLCVPARRVNAVGGGTLDLDGLGPGQASSRLRHGGANSLAGQGVPHEDDEARIILPGHAPAAVHGLTDGEF